MLLGPVTIALEIAGLLAIPTGIVLGIKSKSKAAVIIPSLLFLAGAGMFIYSFFIV
jgi:hypothetical protein